MIIKAKKQKGFTLVEMLVSVALFSIVMIIALSAIVSVFDANKKLTALNSVVENLNTSEDSMIRDIKTGTDYTCGSILPVSAPDSGCSSNGSTAISLRSTIYGASRSVSYTYDQASGTIYKKVCTPNADGSPDTCPAAGSVGVPLTSPEVDVKSLEFYVSNPAPGTGQPGVFIVMSGTAKVNATDVSDFNIQTFVSERALNI